MPSPQTPVDQKPVWALPLHALHCASVEEAVDHCERLLALEGVEPLNLAPWDQQRRTAHVDTLWELDSAKVGRALAAGP